MATTRPILIGQLWTAAGPTGPSAATAVAVTDVLPSGTVVFMHVTNGRRDRLAAGEFRHKFPRLVAEPRMAATPAPDAVVASDAEVPSDF